MKKAAAKLAVLASIIIASTFSYPEQSSAQITAPSPSFEFSPLSPRVGDSVVFDASEFMTRWTESTIVSLVWDFADGTTSTGEVATHIFTQPGDYWVGLTATDDRGMAPMTQLLVTVSKQTPVTIYSSLSNEVIYIGQEVVISGNLTCNNKGVPDERISFSTKIFLDNATWIGIGNTRTDSTGAFSFAWSTSVSKGYQVRALWEGNSTYPETSLSQMLYVSSYGDLVRGFSSNSTITKMNYNSSTCVLSFTAEGPTGSSGYVNVTLEKDPIFDPEKIIVLLDSKPIQYSTTESSQAWTLSFTYAHSKHSILVDFTGKTAPTDFNNTGDVDTTSRPPEGNNQASSLITEIAIIAAILIGALVFVAVIIKSRKQKS